MKTDRLQKLVGGVSRQEGHKHVLKDKENRQNSACLHEKVRSDLRGSPT